DPDKPESALDWTALAAFPGTLVLYMGVRNLEAIAGALIEAGRSADQPAAVVAHGTRPEQRTVTGALGDIAAKAAEAGLEPPAVTIVGEVARLRDELAWFERRPPRAGPGVGPGARARGGRRAAGVGPPARGGGAGRR